MATAGGAARCVMVLTAIAVMAVLDAVGQCLRKKISVIADIPAQNNFYRNYRRDTLILIV